MPRHSLPPLMTFAGCLKYMRLDDASLEDRKVVNTAFPYFFERTEPNSDERRNREVAAKLGIDEFRWRREPRRRFSGGKTLPRARYYSLSKGDAGDDNQTLTNELNAYRDPEGEYFVEAFDLLYKQNCDDLNIPSPRQAVAILVAPSPRSLRSRGLTPPSQPIPSRLLILPYRVETHNIEQTLDLRFPQAQAWFFERFRDGDGEFVRFAQKSPISSFPEMLPRLLQSSHGGNDVTDAIGAFLRTSGVNALIFPSARSDAYVIVENGELKDFGGWNLVDYRGAEAPNLQRILQISQMWTTAGPPGARLDFVPFTSPGAGSWRISGIRDAHEKDYATKLHTEPIDKPVWY